MKKLLLILLMAMTVLPVFGQRYMTRTGKVTFFSKTSMLDIQAINNEVACAMDAKDGSLQFIVLIKSFKFEAALMQEHFNENYMESDKFPKSEFKGKITDISAVNFTKDGTYNVKVSGKLTIHGVTKDVNVPGTIVIKNGEVTANATFNVKCADYGVKIPSLVASKISEDIKVTVNAPMAAIKR